MFNLFFASVLYLYICLQVYTQYYKFTECLDQLWNKYLVSLTFLQMENSAYVPNPLPPPALVVFSQAGGLPDALRMQRPFNPQVCLLICKLMKNKMG
jgi:hypothetical protein